MYINYDDKRRAMKEKTVPITFRIKESVLKKLKQMAREKSHKQEKDITHVDLIREEINKITGEGNGAK